jgi:sugar phosphate isomerase/epimerase
MESMNTQSRLSVSSWSLHRTLGKPPFWGVADEIPQWTPPAGAVPLLELPARVAEFGIKTMEICHFHMPSRDASYLDELRSALEAAGVELWSLLIDDGDVTNAEHGARDRDWIAGWIDVASTLGARNARVIAGKSEPTPENLKLGRDAFRALCARDEAGNVRVMTENWYSLLSTPEHVLWLLDEMEGRVGLCADFGNWSGPDKYEKLAKILPRADSLHAKCRFSGAPASTETMDREDFTRCLDLVKRADFSGPYTLIYDGEDTNEGNALSMEREEVEKYL